MEKWYLAYVTGWGLEGEHLLFAVDCYANNYFLLFHAVDYLKSVLEKYGYISDVPNDWVEYWLRYYLANSKNRQQIVREARLGLIRYNKHAVKCDGCAKPLY